MNLKLLVLILLPFFAVSAAAQQAQILECIGSTKVGASSNKSFNGNSYTKAQDTKILITIKNNALTVDENEFKEIETHWNINGSDAFISSHLEEKDTHYHGTYIYEVGELHEESYIYASRTIYLNRLNGEFSYSLEFYNKNIKDNWLGKLSKTQLVNGYLIREIEGKCRKSNKRQLF